MAKKKKGKKKRTSLFAIKEQSKAIEKQVLVTCTGIKGNQKRGRKSSTTFKVVRAKSHKFCKASLDNYTTYKTIYSLLNQLEIYLSTEELQICQEIGQQKIEQKITNLQAQLASCDRFFIKQMIIDFLKNEIEEIKTWRALKQEIIALKDLQTNRLFETAKLFLYEALLPSEDNASAAIDLAKIRQAGEIIYNAKGMAGMRDTRLWNFIPKSCYNLINETWNNIGKCSA